jgi:hypothetical protein
MLREVLVQQVEGFGRATGPRGFARLLVEARGILRGRRQRRQPERERHRHRQRRTPRTHRHHLRHLRFPVIHRSIAKRTVVIRSATIST